MDIVHIPRNCWFNLTKAWPTDSLMSTAHRNWKISLKTACWSDFSVTGLYRPVGKQCLQQHFWGRTRHWSWQGLFVCLRHLVSTQQYFPLDSDALILCTDSDALKLWTKAWINSKWMNILNTMSIFAAGSFDLFTAMRRSRIIDTEWWNVGLQLI